MSRLVSENEIMNLGQSGYFGVFINVTIGFISGFLILNSDIHAESATKETTSITQTDPINFLHSNVSDEPKDDTKPIRLLIGGDVHYTWGVTDPKNNPAPLAVIQGIIPLFNQADIKIFNLETVISSNLKPLSNRSYPFNAESSISDLFTGLKIDAVFLANNHTGDYRSEGILQTIEFLENKGIAGIGAGLNPTEAIMPFYITIKNIKFAFLSVSTVSNDEDYSVGNRPGIPSIGQVIRAVNLARANADHVIVGIHWGWEYRTEPETEQRILGKRIIDAGASAIIGHHPHIPQGVEIYKNGIIYYSLGNFIFGSVNQMQTHNILAELSFDPKTKAFSKAGIIPILGAYRNSGHTIKPLESISEFKETWAELYLQTYSLSPLTAQKLRIYENGYGELSIP
jgi:poly-gamma-glutamate synthesis protein (capsule biosynthesis protein)